MLGIKTAYSCLVKVNSNQVVYFLTEGSKAKGFGHLTRCISIQQAFAQKGVDSVFFVHGDQSAWNLLRGMRYEPVDWVRNPEAIISRLKPNDLVVLDSLEADLSSIEQIIKNVRHPVIIDDYKHYTYSHGIVVDWTLFAEERGLNNDKITFLAGSDYVALRKPFWNILPRTGERDVKRILITMGGTDVRNLTFPLLKCLVFHLKGVHVSALVNESFGNLREIEQFKTEQETVSLYYRLKDFEIAACFEQTDLAISAGGQTLYELARTGTPTIAIQIADNQEHDIRGWLRTGFIEFAGLWNEEHLLNRVLEMIRTLSGNADLRKKKQITGMKYVDGQGAHRLVERIISLANDVQE
jgi:UDP-2,4-diacetamido-2,4,6-trideoxy-beta-L-altropyranose hydrolase